MEFASLTQFTSKTKYLLFPGGFTSIVRSLFGLNEILSEQQKIIEGGFKNGLGILYTVKDVEKNTIKLAKNYSRFSRWLLGLDKVISGCNKIAEEIANARIDFVVINKRYKTEESELDQLNRDMPVTSQFRILTGKKTNKPLDGFLAKKQRFIDHLPKPVFEEIPYFLSRWEGGHLYGPQLGGQKATFFNLKNEMALSTQRQEREYNWNPYDSSGRATRDRVIDGCDTNIRWARDEIRKLSEKAIVVSVDELGNPQVSAPSLQK